MNYATYHRYCTSTAWRFSTLRSAQLAASERTSSGGNPEHMAQMCRTTR
jgi:hypothetical protein